MGIKIAHFLLVCKFVQLSEGRRENKMSEKKVQQLLPFFAFGLCNEIYGKDKT